MSEEVTLEIKEEPREIEEYNKTACVEYNNLQVLKSKDFLSDVRTSSKKYNSMNNLHEEGEEGGCIEIVKEQDNLITVQVADNKSEDELDFIAKINAQGKLKMKSSNVQLQTFKATCRKCQQVFYNATKYATHPTNVRFELNKCDRQKCIVCPLTFDTLLELAEHFELHRSNRFFCKIYCGCHFETVEQCEEHEADEHRTYTLKCGICSNSFSNRAALAQHKLTHAQHIVCSNCRKYFETTTELLLHWQRERDSPCGRLMKNVRTVTPLMCGSKPLVSKVLPYRLKSAPKKKLSSSPTNTDATMSKRYKPSITTANNELEASSFKTLHSATKIMPEPFIKVEIKNEPLDEDEYDALSNTLTYFNEEGLNEIACDVEIKTEPAEETIYHFNNYDELITKANAANKNNIASNKMSENIFDEEKNLPAYKIITLTNKLNELSPSAATQNTLPPSVAVKIQNDKSKFIPIDMQGLKIYKLPANIKIVALPCNGQTSALPSSIQNNSSTQQFVELTAKMPPDFELADSAQVKQLLDELKQNAEENNHNLCLPKRLLNLIDNLPEKRELIDNIKEQIKYAENGICLKELPRKLKATNVKDVLASAAVVKVAQTVAAPAVLPPQTTAASSPIQTAAALQTPPTFWLPVMRNYDGELLDARRIYSNYRFVWSCPSCVRIYEQKSSFRTHLVIGHSMCREDLEGLLVEVKPEPKKIPPNIPTISVIPAATPITTTISTPAADTPIGALISMPNIAAAATIITAAAAPSTIADISISQPSADDIKTTSTLKEKRSKRGYECTKCGRVCSSRVMLDDHVRGDCSRIPQYSCTQCPKNFFSASTLACHMSIHTGELPHKCNFCDKRFRTRGQVTVHHRTHTGERPFTCEICSQSFTHRETLIAHLSRHIGIKRYKCYGCDNTFSCISGLRVHRDIRPDTCGKVKFNSRAVGPRIRVIRGSVVFEPQPDINPYLRTEDPAEILSEIQNQQSTK